MSTAGWNLETATSFTPGGSSDKTLLRLSSTILPGLFLLHLGLHLLRLLETLLPLALLRFLSFGSLELGLDLLRMDEPFLDDLGLQHRDEVGEQIVVTET